MAPLPKWSPGAVGPSVGGDPFAGMYGAEDEQNASFMDPMQAAEIQDAAVRPDPGSTEQQFAAIQDTEDAELERNLAAAGVDPEVAAQASRARSFGPYDVMGEQMLGSEQAYGNALQTYLANQPLRGSRVNPKAPFVKERLQERKGVAFSYPEFVPEQPKPIPGLDDETNQLLAEADIQGQYETYLRQREEAEAQAGILGEDTRLIGRAPGAPGMEEAQRQAQEGVDASKIATAETAAEGQVAYANEVADATERTVDALELQRQREQEQMERVARVRQVREQARKDLAALPEITRQRAIQGMSQGNKIAAVLGAIAQGWRGEAPTMVRDAISTEMQDLTDRYTRKQQEYGAIVDEADEALNVLDFYVNSMGGNVRAGAQLMHEAKTEAALAQIDAALAKATVPEVRAALLQARTATEGDLRAMTQQVEYEYATTPSQIGYSIDSAGRRLAREEARADMKQAREEGADIRKEARGVAVKDYERAADADVAMQLEGVKSEGKRAAAVAGEQTKQEFEIKKASDEWGAVEKLVQDYRKEMKGNYHGVGMPLTGSQEQRIKTRNFKRALELLATTGFTGATATDRQVEQIQGLIEGDWTEVTDEAFDTRLNTIENIASARRRYYQDQIGPATKKLTASELPTFVPDEE